MPRTLRSTAIAFTLVTSTILGLVVVGACKKDPPPAPIELPPPAVVDAGVPAMTIIDDAGDAAPEAEAPKPRGNGAPWNANAAHVRQCCNAIRHQAKNLGVSPEATIMMGIAIQCDMVAAQVGGGAAPEFAQVRQMLKGRTLPAACAGM